MSEQDRPDILRVTVPGDWWTVAALVESLIYVVLRTPAYAGLIPGPIRLDPQGEMLDKDTTYTSAVWIVDRLTHDPLGVLGEYHVSAGRENTTTLQIAPARAEYIALWEEVLTIVQATHGRARELRRIHLGLTTDEIIEHFYRQKAAGGKLTLKDYAEASGVPYSTLSKRKMEYDRAGKWGSRKTNRKT